MRRRAHPDPKPPTDGRCFVCQRTRPKVAVTHEDPFCSTDCCKLWHSRLARRLNLWQSPRELLPSGRRELTLTASELLWIVQVAVPQMRQHDGKAA